MTTEKADWAERAGPLLERARGGDAGALGQLMELYRSYLLAIAGAELNDGLRAKSGASDVVQETFVEAMGLFARFEGSQGDEFRAWLRAILVNKLAEVRKHYFGVQKRQNSSGDLARCGFGGGRRTVRRPGPRQFSEPPSRPRRNRRGGISSARPADRRRSKRPRLAAMGRADLSRNRPTHGTKRRRRPHAVRPGPRTLRGGTAS